VRLFASNQARSTIGNIIFLLCVTQSLTGLLLSRSRVWMYRRLPVGAFGLLGLAGLAFFALGRSASAFFVGAALYGVYAGSLFFYLVFHSLAHPSRSTRYVAVNESIMGATGILGPLIGGFLADARGFGCPLTVAIAAGAAVLVFQQIAHARNPAPVSTTAGQSRAPA